MGNDNKPNIDTFDLIIVGGGTSGLLLAERLSKENISILVLEAGHEVSNLDADAREGLENVHAYTKNLGGDRDWKFESVPQPSLNGRTPVQSTGKILGGSSSINGGFYVAPSRSGLNAWATLGNTEWNYEKLAPYAQRTINYNPPDEEVCKSMSIEADRSRDHQNNEDSQKIQVTSMLYPEPLIQAYSRVISDVLAEGGSDPKISDALFRPYNAGLSIHNFTKDPDTGYRSSPGSCFKVATSDVDNVTILRSATVRQILLDGDEPNVVATGVEVSLENPKEQTRVIRYKARKEVILAAGALNTPRLLELSGIGQADRLQKYGINVRIHNNGVGEHLGNHIMSWAQFELNEDVKLTAGISAFLPLPDLHELRATFDHDAKSRKRVDTGEQEYEDAVKSIYLDPREGSFCHYIAPLGEPGQVMLAMIQAIPFSRGSSHIASPDIGNPPNVDPAFLRHDLDMEVMARHLRLSCSLPQRPALQKFFKTGKPTSPFLKAAARADNLEEYRQFLRENAQTTYHSHGTAALLPKEKGGVVNQELFVYGTKNLRIVDASIMPLIPHGNPISVVYAIAERAADLIKGSGL